MYGVEIMPSGHPSSPPCSYHAHVPLMMQYRNTSLPASTNGLFHTCRVRVCRVRGVRVRVRSVRGIFKMVISWRREREGDGMRRGAKTGNETERK